MHEVNSSPGSGARGVGYSPQLPKAVFQGDPLELLLNAGNVASGPAAGRAELALETITATVISIDGRKLRARELRQRLKNERREFARAVASLPRARHLIVLLQIERETERAFTRALDRAAHRAHSELEMRLSRDICVTGIVITNDANTRTLMQRLDERIRSTPIEGSHVVSARRILMHSISSTAAEDLL